MRHPRFLAHAIALSLALIAWPTVADLLPSVSAASPRERSVTLFAAASTGHALDEIKADFTKKYGVEVKTSYAATSALAQQVVHGAEAAVFVSANTKWADFLQQQGLVAARQDLLGNRLVMVVPVGASIAPARLEDLLSARIRHIAMADPEGVPAGIYARNALAKRGLWDRLKSKVAAADHVQHALAYVETGAAEAGFVYATDAAASKKVKVVLAIGPSLTGPIVYPILLLKPGADSPAAVSLYRYLSSPAAIRVFREHGFSILAEAASHQR